MMHLFQISYTSDNVVEGKKAAKEALQQKLGLKRSDLPLVGIITRLTHQKGIHLIKHAIWRTLDRNGQVIFCLLFYCILFIYFCTMNVILFFPQHVNIVRVIIRILII